MIGFCPRRGTHPSFGYPLQNGARELCLSPWSRLEKGGLSLSLRRRAVRWVYYLGAVGFGISTPMKASRISYNQCFDYSYNSLVLISGKLRDDACWR